MKIEQSKRQLLQEICNFNNEGKVNFKTIHEATGLDYNKDFTIFKQAGKFTINSILKIHPLENNQVMFVFMGNHNCVKFAQIDRWGGLNIDVNNQVGFVHKFYAKCDFEKARKENTIAYFIICNEEDLTETSDKKNPYNYHHKIKGLFKTGDLNTQFKIKNHIMGSSSRCDFDFVSGFDLYIKGQKSSKYAYIRLDEVLPFYMDRRTSPKTIEEVIDKSGYNVAMKRHNLRNKAEIMKTNNKKRELRHADFSAENESLRAEIITLKRQIMDKLTNCGYMDSQQIESIGRLLYINYCNLIKYYQKHIEKLKKARNNDNTSEYYNYTTIEQVQKEIQSLNDRITNIYEDLAKIG